MVGQDSLPLGWLERTRRGLDGLTGGALGRRGAREMIAPVAAALLAAGALIVEDCDALLCDQHLPAPARWRASPGYRR